MSDTPRPAGGPSPQPPFDREIHVRAIGQFGIWLTVVVVVAGALMYWFYRDLERREKALDAPASPLVDRTKPHLPPEPRLQVTAELDLQAYLAEERRKQTTYGWVDEKLGIVHIPIDRAIDLVAERGLPVWSAEPPVALQESAPRRAAPRRPGRSQP